MRIVVPIVRAFRKELVRFSPVPNKNWLLRRILYLLERLDCLTTCSGEVYIVSSTVKQVMTFVRAPDEMAKRTFIENLGADFPATIFESGRIVAIVPPGQNRELTAGGAFLIQGKCDGATIIEVTTYRYCPCGEKSAPIYGVGVKPIGGDLI